MFKLGGIQMKIAVIMTMIAFGVMGCKSSHSGGTGASTTTTTGSAAGAPSSGYETSAGQGQSSMQGQQGSSAATGNEVIIKPGQKAVFQGQ
jgi:hypothetical protein